MVGNSSVGNSGNAQQEYGVGSPRWKSKDLNHDGVQDSIEPGANSVAVALLDNAGHVISTTSTYNFMGHAGYYTFTNLISGTYVVSFTIPASYEPTLANVGGDATDSDGSNVKRQMSNVIASTEPYVLNAGESNPTVDQGLWRPASLGDRVWWDHNRDGLQSIGEPGVPNVTVRLLDSNGTVISTTVTDANGLYLFSNLISQTHTVVFALSTLPAGAHVTTQNVTGAGKDVLDSDADVSTGRTELIPLLPGEHDLAWDMGIWVPASLGDFVWEDRNHNGTQEASEPGIPGVQVTLHMVTGRMAHPTPGRYRQRGQRPRIAMSSTTMVVLMRWSCSRENSTRRLTQVCGGRPA